jgi:DNA topoisomerase VI subunit A
MSTRAFVSKLSKYTGLKVLGVSDYNPDGLDIILQYKFPSKTNRFESAGYQADIKWCCLRKTHVKDMLLTQRGVHELQSRDFKMIRSMLESEKMDDLQKYRDELRKMEKRGLKVQLEALEDLVTLIVESIKNHDYI